MHVYVFSFITTTKNKINNTIRENLRVVEAESFDDAYTQIQGIIKDTCGRTQNLVDILYIRRLED